MAETLDAMFDQFRNTILSMLGEQHYDDLEVTPARAKALKDAEAMMLKFEQWFDANRQSMTAKALRGSYEKVFKKISDLVVPGVKDPVPQGVGEVGSDKPTTGATGKRPIEGATPQAHLDHLDRALKSEGLNEADWKALPPTKKQAIMRRIAEAQRAGKPEARVIAVTDAGEIVAFRESAAKPGRKTSEATRFGEQRMQTSIKLQDQLNRVAEKFGQPTAFEATRKAINAKDPRVTLQALYADLGRVTRGINPKFGKPAQKALDALGDEIYAWEKAVAEGGKNIPDIRASVNRTISEVEKQVGRHAAALGTADVRSDSDALKSRTLEQSKARRAPVEKFRADLKAGKMGALATEAMRERTKLGGVTKALKSGPATKELIGKLGKGANTLMMLMFGLDIAKSLIGVPKEATAALAERPAAELQTAALPSVASIMNDMKMQRMMSGEALAGLSPDDLNRLVSTINHQTTGLDVAPGERIIGPARSIGPALQQVAQGSPSGLDSMLAAI